MKIDEAHGKIAALLRQNGIAAVESWPEGRRERHEDCVVLVSMERVQCSPAGMQDYLGQRADEEDGKLKEIYGRRAEMTFTLDVLAEKGTPAQTLRRTANDLARLFQTERPEMLTVREMRIDEIRYDETEGLLCLRCELECEGLLCTAGEEAGTFLDFTLRGDVET